MAARAGTGQPRSEGAALPIERDKGFLFSGDTLSVPCLGIESDKLSACITRIREAGLKGVFGSPAFGFTGHDLDFLYELPGLEQVWFWDIKLKNIDGLYALPDLRHFGIHPKRPAIQFDRFARLETAVIELQARDSGLDQLKELQKLHLWRCKDDSLASLRLPDSLVELQLNWASMSTLDRLPALPHLHRLEISRCRNLEDLGRLSDKFPNLEYLVVEACGRMTAEAGTRSIEGLTKMKHVFVQTAVLTSSPQHDER